MSSATKHSGKTTDVQTQSAKQPWSAIANNKRPNTNLADAVAFAKAQEVEGLKGEAAKKRCVKIAWVLLTLTILVVLNVAVLVTGAFLFNYLEHHNEVTSCVEARKDYLESSRVTENLMILKTGEMQGAETITDEAKFKLEKFFKGYLVDFAKEVGRIGYNPKHNCTYLGANAQWTITNSLIFSLTVITTIGYGVIAPATSYGRLICIAYAIIGIPVYMVTLAKIGDWLAGLFKKAYWLACCCGCWKKKPEPLTLLNARDELARETSNLRVPDNRSKPQSTIEVVGHGDDEECENDPKYANNVTIPLTITMSVLLGAVVVGSILFLIFEGWDYTNALYFSFTTISTIGFGDLVPTFDLSEGAGFGKLAATIIYITVGMATMSMCFQLMADEIVAKFVWIGEKCGVRKKPDCQDSTQLTEEESGSSDVFSKSPSFVRRNNPSISLSRSGTRTSFQMRRSKSKLSPATSRKK